MTQRSFLSEGDASACVHKSALRPASQPLCNLMNLPHLCILGGHSSRLQLRARLSQGGSQLRLAGCRRFQSLLIAPVRHNLECAGQQQRRSSLSEAPPRRVRKSAAPCRLRSLPEPPSSTLQFLPTAVSISELLVLLPLHSAHGHTWLLTRPARLPPQLCVPQQCPAALHPAAPPAALPATPQPQPPPPLPRPQTPAPKPPVADAIQCAWL